MEQTINKPPLKHSKIKKRYTFILKSSNKFSFEKFARWIQSFLGGPRGGHPPPSQTLCSSILKLKGVQRENKNAKEESFQYTNIDKI
jgi:hypothetical protein